MEKAVTGQTRLSGPGNQKNRTLRGWTRVNFPSLLEIVNSNALNM